VLQFPARPAPPATIDYRYMCQTPTAFCGSFQHWIFNGCPDDSPFFQDSSLVVGFLLCALGAFFFTRR